MINLCGLIHQLCNSVALMGVLYEIDAELKGSAQHFLV